MVTARLHPFFYALLGLNFGVSLINYLVIVFVLMPAALKHG